jgi:hypothetical protein
MTALGIRGRVLGSLQEGPDNRARQGAKESGQVFSPLERSDLGNSGLAEEDSTLMCPYKAFGGERAWKAIGDRLERPHCLSRADRNHKIRNKRQKTDIGKYLFVNRTIEHWNQLPAEVLDPLRCNLTIFRRRIRKVISVVR